MNILPIALGGAALLYFLSKSGSSSCTKRMVRLPDGREVCETELPQMGYVLYNGSWYHQTQFEGTGQYEGVDTTSPRWYETLTNMINTGTNLFQLVEGTGILPGARIDIVNQQANLVTVDIKVGPIEERISVSPTTSSRKVDEAGRYGYQVIQNSRGSSTINLYDFDRDNPTIKTLTINW